MQLGAPLEIGSGVNVDVLVRQEEAAILVPTDALMGGYVWVVEEKRAVRRKVEVGSAIDGRAHILFGLEDGDEIILDAPPELHAGRRIAVIKGPPRRVIVVAAIYPVSSYPNLPSAAAVSSMRLENPHSLSYQDKTRQKRLSITWVWVTSKVELLGL